MFSFIHRALHSASARRVPRRRTRLSVESLENRALLSLIGSELHVNTDTADDQDDSAVACSSNGACVVAWTSFVNGDFDIRAQLYDANGDPFGSEIVVANTVNDELEPAVAMDSSGFFVVVWREDLPDEDEADILAQQFSPDGDPVGGTVFVESSFRFAYEPSVAMAANGDFVVAYTQDDPDPDVIAKMYFSDNALFRRINVAVSGFDEHSPSVARSADGRFGVAYEIDAGFDFSGDIRLRRFSAAGRQMGSHRITNTFWRPEANPSVAMDDAGNAIVSYEVFVDGDWDIHARNVTNRGRLGRVIVVQDFIGIDETNPTIARDRLSGNFVVAYETGPDRNRHVEVAEFASSGARRATFDLGGNRDFPSISIDGNGFYFVTYTSFDRGGDPDAGIFGQFGDLR